MQLFFIKLKLNATLVPYLIYSTALNVFLKGHFVVRHGRGKAGRERKDFEFKDTGSRDTPPRRKSSRSKAKISAQDEESEYIYTLEDTDDEKTQGSSGSQSSSTERDYQICMLVAAAVVGSAFLGIVMKFAFTPNHIGHRHSVRRVDRRVFVEPFPEAPPPAEPDLTTLPTNRSDNATHVPARRSMFTYECRTDACLWQSRLIYDKINQSIAPCEDFHAYVCSNRWYVRDLDVQGRPYAVSGPGLLILDVANYLLRQKDKEGQPAFIGQSAAFLRGCINHANASKGMPSWNRVTELFDTLSLTGWPFLTDPVAIKFQKVLMEVDKTLALFPIVDVSLRKRFENEGYMLHLDAPKLVLVRHQMTFLEEGMQDYKKCIKRALSLLGSKADMDHMADDILELERRLDEASLPPRKFVTILNSTVPIANIKRTAKFEWETYLPHLQSGSDKVIVRNAAFVEKLPGVLTSTALSTLLNYIGFRIMVFLSPLLPKEAGFLIPLSYDDHIPMYNPRLQACVHLLERLYPYGTRKIARLSMGKTAMEQVLYDHNLDSLVRIVKDAMMQTVAHAPWLTQAEADIARQKIQILEVDFIGAKENLDTVARYYVIKTKANFTTNSTLHDYLTLLNESTSRYWASKDNADYDARYHVSCLKPGFEYNAGRNSLYMPYGVVAFQHRVSQTTVPAILMPFIVPHLVQGMYEAVDVRGSSISVRGMPESWWSEESLARYRKQQRCFVESYLEHMQRFGAFKESPMVPFIRQMMAENAALQPSLEAYSRALVEPHSMQRNFRVPGLPEMTPDMLFFVNFAASHCDAVQGNSGLGVLARRQVQYRVALPSVLRVNVPLRNFDRFAEVFYCPKGTYMNPGAKCRLW
ncbi:neprilysin-1-like [Ixodes scapularis]|uniref:neprilysin-1-like n=1 Tax=Ixodes scapularis TaxID=6945 RepID=UPI001A9D1E92|nr:neprilysin-1-like [Ixodes scapularis]